MAKLSQVRKYHVLETFRSKVSPLSEKGGLGIGNVNEGSAEGEVSQAAQTFILSITYNLRNVVSINSV